MAVYREFPNEKYYEAPDMRQFTNALVVGAQRTGDAIGDIFKSMAEQKLAKKKASDAYKFELGNGSFETDDKIFDSYGYYATHRGKNETLTEGRISADLEKRNQEMLVNKNESDWQHKNFTDTAARITSRGKNDIYFDEEYEHLKNFKVNVGDFDFRTRGDRQKAYEKELFTDPKSFKGKLYAGDYVKNFGAKEASKSTGDPTYDNSNYYKTPFLDEKGAPGITVAHAKEYLNSRGDGMVGKWVESLVDEDMAADISYNKQRSPELANMTDDQVRMYLKVNPDKNQLNQKDYATRVIEKAQQQLREAADISNKTDYKTKIDKSITNGLYKNDKISHGFTPFVDQPIVKGGTTTGNALTGWGVQLDVPLNNMYGGTLRQAPGTPKQGQAIPIPLNPRNSYNVRTGKNSSLTGTTLLNTEAYQLGAYNKKNQYVPMDADNLDKVPNSAFKDLQPTLQMSIRGFTVDKSNSLGELATHEADLNTQYGEAMRTGDVEKQQTIKTQLDAVNALRESMNKGPLDFSETDLLNGYRKTGIAVTNMQSDVIVKAADADKVVIDRNVTQGLNIDDKSKWNEDMLRTDADYQRRYQKAAAAGFQDAKSDKTVAPAPKKPATTAAPKQAAAPAQTALPIITSDADYAKLPVGAKYQYTDSYGNVRTKTKVK